MVRQITCFSDEEIETVFIVFFKKIPDNICIHNDRICYLIFFDDNADGAELFGAMRACTLITWHVIKYVKCDNFLQGVITKVQRFFVHCVGREDFVIWCCIPFDLVIDVINQVLGTPVEYNSIEDHLVACRAVYL